MNTIINLALTKLSLVPTYLGTPFKLVPIRMYQLGKYECPQSGLIADLSEYFIDQDGDFYSMNRNTYVTKYGRKLVKLANSSKDKHGDYINTLRSERGDKVTVRRSILVNMMKLGRFTEVTDTRLNNILKGV